MSKGILTQETSPVDDLFIDSSKNDLRNSAYEIRRKSWIKDKTDKIVKTKVRMFFMCLMYQRLHTALLPTFCAFAMSGI